MSADFQHYPCITKKRRSFSLFLRTKKKRFCFFCPTSPVAHDPRSAIPSRSAIVCTDQIAWNLPGWGPRGNLKEQCLFCRLNSAIHYAHKVRLRSRALLHFTDFENNLKECRMDADWMICNESYYCHYLCSLSEAVLFFSIRPSRASMVINNDQSPITNQVCYFIPF